FNRSKLHTLNLINSSISSSSSSSSSSSTLQMGVFSTILHNDYNFSNILNYTLFHMPGNFIVLPNGTSSQRKLIYANSSKQTILSKYVLCWLK
ncbi:unnamed protein product, partial [Schistosoma rodhaini]|uniref:Uncharacterized protein n=1 Tax=Schistosoma rodhaini TaxID=6188 RepID=A0AA85FD62_9TREM